MTPENNLPESNRPQTIVEETTVVVAEPQTVPVVRKKPILIKRNRGGMFDVPEMIAVGIGGLMLLLVLFSYLFLLRPAQENLRRREQARDQMDLEYKKLTEQIGEGQTTQSSVDNLLGSLERFETNFLSTPSQGGSAVFARLNELIRANGLRNTAGPDYAPLQTVGIDKFKPEEQAGKGRLQSLYPGTIVSLTVEGGYGNLRRFISDLENSRQFMVISSVEIEAEGGTSGSGGGGQTVVRNTAPARNTQLSSGLPPGTLPEPKNNPANPRAAQNAPVKQPAQTIVEPPRNTTASRQRGSTVSLRLELIAYFRRSEPTIVNSGGVTAPNNQIR